MNRVPARHTQTNVRHTTLGLPIKLSVTPGGPRHAAPLLGEHTRAVLAEHGYSAPEIDALIAEGAVLARE